MDDKKYVLTKGTHVSYWYQGHNYAVVKYVYDYGITLQLYKVIKDKNEPDDYEPEYSAGDIAFFTWMACPNLKLGKASVEQEASYASYT